MKINECIIRSIKDLFLPEVIKTILISAIPLLVFYMGVVYLFWYEIIGISNFLISWVPFSVLKINGAFFILFFVWLVSVLITFAAITAIFGPIILNRFERKGYYFYVIGLITVLSLIYGVFFINKWDYINMQIQRFLTLLPFDTVSTWVGAIVGVYIFYNLFILTLFFLVFIFSNQFLDAIAEIEGYGSVDLKGSISKVLRDIGMFMLFFILLFPLFFIPVLNIFVQLFLWSKLYKDSFSSVIEAKEANIIALLAALFNFLPLINFFAPFFGIILFYHCANLD